jgi:hypothetical protein
MSVSNIESSPLEEVYLPVCPPIPYENTYEPLPMNMDISPTNKKTVRYVNILNELKLILIDGPMMNNWSESNTSEETMNPTLLVYHSGRMNLNKMKISLGSSLLKISEEERARWKENLIER